MRRNSNSFSGEGTPGWTKFTPFGNYNDTKQNHKDKDYKIANDRRSRLGIDSIGYKMDAKGNIIAPTSSGKNRRFCKKYADNHQKY